MFLFFCHLAGILFGLAIFAAFMPQIPVIIMLALGAGGLVASYVAFRLGPDPDANTDDEQRD